VPEKIASQLPPKRKWPRFTDEQKQLIIDFLSDWLENAVAAHEASETMLKIAPQNPTYAPQERYWRNVCSAIQWLLSHTNSRQRSLQIRKMLADGEITL